MRPGDYVRSLFDPRDRVALVAIPRGEAGGRVLQTVQPAEVLAAGRTQAWLRHLDAQRHDIFLGVNPVRPGAWDRTKAAIGDVLRVYLDIDEDGERALARIRAEALVKGLAARYRADMQVIEVARVLRWPGYRNWKRRGTPCRLVSSSGRVAQVSEFPSDLSAPRAAAAVVAPGTRPAVSGGGDSSPSGRDWAWVRHQLRKGRDPEALVEDLATRRSDKPKPLAYARRTVERAVGTLRAEREGRPWRP